MRIKGQILGVIGVSLLVGLGVGFGLIALIVPGVLLALMWSLAVPVKVLEDKGVRMLCRAVRISQKETAVGYLVIWLLVYVLSIGISLLIQWPVELAAGASSPAAMARAGAGWQVASLAAAFVSQCLVGPLATIAFSLVYYDERVRKEAFDLQLMMTTIDAATLPGPPHKSAHEFVEDLYPGVRTDWSTLCRADTQPVMALPAPNISLNLPAPYRNPTT